MQKYDVIVIGGSISGLLLASELSLNNEVLVIEKNAKDVIPICFTGTYKYYKNTFFEKYIKKTFKCSYVRTLSKKKSYIYDDFISFDEKAIFNDLFKIIKTNGSKIMYNTEFKKIIKNKKEEITIATGKGNFSSRLLIDCTGNESTIAENYKMYKRRYYYNIYGGVYNKKIIDEKDIAFVDIFEKSFNIFYFEFFPINDTQIVAYTFDFSKDKVDPRIYKEKEIEYLKLSGLGVKQEDKVKEIIGNIAMGEIKGVSQNNIFLYGDSALTPPSNTGLGFYLISATYKEVSEFLNRRLKENNLSKRDLNYKFNYKIKMNQQLQLMGSSVISSISTVELSELFDIFVKRTDYIIKYAFCCFIFFSSSYFT